MKNRLLTNTVGLICVLFFTGFLNNIFAQYITTAEALARPSNQIVVVSGETYEDNNGSYEYTYDARGWTTNSTEIYPFKIGNNTPGTRQVLLGGEVYGQSPRNTTWKDMKAHYDGTAILMRSKDYLIIDGIRTDNAMDAVRPRSNSSTFLISNVYATFTRDDAVEDDEMMAGIIDDCLFDGCFMFLSQQGSQTWSTTDSLKVRNTLARLQPMPYDTNVKGNPPEYESKYGVNADRHAQLFKHHGPGDAPLIVENCIFYVPQISVNGTSAMSFPDFAGCKYSNNILLWTGGGKYPGALPASGVTEYNLINSTQEQIDQIWDSAVSDWISRHGYDVKPYNLVVENGSGDGEYTLGTEVTIQADAPAAGKVFDKWVGDVAYIANQYDTVTTVTMPTIGIKLIATYKNIQYSLSVTNGSGDGQYSMGAQVIIKADSPSPGKKFEMWTGDVAYVADQYNSNTIVTMPMSDISLTATYSDAYYTLTVNNGSGDGDYIMGTEVIVEADSSAAGEKFDQWTGDVAYVADQYDSITSVIMPMSDISLTATYVNIVSVINSTVDDKFLLYPNPARGRVTITNIPENGIVSINKLTGQLINSYVPSSDKLELDIHELKKGIYIVTIISKGKSQVDRLIIL